MRVNLPGAYPGLYSRPAQPKFGMTVAQSEPRTISGSEELKARCAAVSTEEGAILVFRDWVGSSKLLQGIVGTALRVEDSLSDKSKVLPDDKQKLQESIEAFLKLAGLITQPDTTDSVWPVPPDASDALGCIRRIFGQGIQSAVYSDNGQWKPRRDFIAYDARRLRGVKNVIDQLPV